MLSIRQNIVLWILLLVQIASNTLAGEYTDLAGYIKIPFPKLKITEAWLIRNENIKIPEHLHGKAVSILGTLENKTLISDENNIVYEVYGVLNGDYSYYEEKYNPYTYWSLEEFANKEDIEFPQFEILGLPQFNPFAGKLKRYSGGGGGFDFRGIKNALTVLSSDDWEKSNLEVTPEGVPMATFTIPIRIKNETDSIIKDFSATFYLIGSDGKKHYSKDNILIKEILPQKEVRIHIKARAPADDFSIPVFESSEDKLILDNPFGEYKWEEEALNRKTYESLEYIEEKLTKMLKYTSTKEGYNRILSKISFLWIRMGKYMNALSIIDKLQKEKIDQNTKNFLALQEIIALIKSHKLKSALMELNATNEEVMPLSYKDYLIRCCLRQIEKEEALNSAKMTERNKKYFDTITFLQNKCQNKFKINTIVTLFPKEIDVKHQVIRMYATQGQYEEAIELYAADKIDDAERLLIYLLENKAEEMAFRHNRCFKLGPAVLDLLGKVYLEKEEIDAAMDCFRKMYEFYRYDYFMGPWDGEMYYGGPGGAEGLESQLRVLVRGMEYKPGRTIWIRLPSEPDYGTVVSIAHLLIKEFDGVRCICWEFCPNYEEIGAFYLLKYLEDKNASSETWEREIRKAIDNTKNQYLQADLLIKLGKKYEDSFKIDNAVRVYKEVANRYRDLYYISEGDGEFRVYPLEALKAILEIYQNTGYSEPYIQKVKNEMHNVYERIQNLMKQGRYMDYELKQLEKLFQIEK
jgi:hypothetical protein